MMNNLWYDKQLKCDKYLTMVISLSSFTARFAKAATASTLMVVEVGEEERSSNKGRIPEYSWSDEKTINFSNQHQPPSSC